MTSPDVQETPITHTPPEKLGCGVQCLLLLFAILLTHYIVTRTHNFVSILYIRDAYVGKGAHADLIYLLPVIYFAINGLYVVLLSRLLRHKPAIPQISVRLSLMVGIVSVGFVLFALVFNTPPYTATAPDSGRLVRYLGSFRYWMEPYARPAAQSGKTLYLMNMVIPTAYRLTSLSGNRLHVSFEALNTGYAHRITRPAYDIRFLSWSPKSERLGYYASYLTSKGEIWYVNMIDAGGRHHVRARSAKPAAQLKWSPDGTRLRFADPSMQWKVLDATGTVSNAENVTAAWRISEPMRVQPFSDAIYWFPARRGKPRVYSECAFSADAGLLAFAYNGMGVPFNRAWVLLVYLLVGIFGSLALVLGLRTPREVSPLARRIGICCGVFSILLFTLALF